MAMNFSMSDLPINATSVRFDRAKRLQESFSNEGLANQSNWFKSTAVAHPRYLTLITNADVIAIERPKTNSKLFAHTRWDAVPALAGLFHLAYFFGLFLLYPHAPLWVMLVLGFVYSLMVNANINGIGHNFIHNPFFRSKILNRLFGKASASSRQLRICKPCELAGKSLNA
jgi:hypothetical protein